MPETLPGTLLETLTRDGIVALPRLMDEADLRGLQQAFTTALAHPSFNTWIGYEQNEKWRLLVENALVLHPAVVRLALHPLVKAVIGAYLGPHMALTEARGWKTIATRTLFHGWHNDAWYAPSTSPPPREVKLALYLTDVESGYFSYIAGSHDPHLPPRHWSPRDVAPLIARRKDMRGPAGTLFLFDTAGIHCQTTPVLTPRNVLFLNYHDPDIPIQDEDIRQGRYRPLLLNAGFLPPLEPDDQRILGIGRPAPDPTAAAVGRPAARRYPLLHTMVASSLALRLEAQELNRQIRRVRSWVVRKCRRPSA